MLPIEWAYSSHMINARASYFCDRKLKRLCTRSHAKTAANTSQIVNAATSHLSAVGTCGGAQHFGKGSAHDGTDKIDKACASSVQTKMCAPVTRA